LEIDASTVQFLNHVIFSPISVIKEGVFISLNIKKCMKSRIVFISALLFISWAANSCEALNGCKVCQDITYEDGKEVFATPEREFCDDDLIRKEATPDVHVGNQIIKVKCQ
jgi:hypothetical protein